MKVGSIIYAYGIALALFVIPLLSVTPRSMYFSEDQGFMFAVSEALRVGELPLIGPPSHLAGRHLGSILFWITSGALTLANGDTFIASTILAGFSALGALLLLQLTATVAGFSPSWLGIIVSALVLVAGQFNAQLRYPWYAHLLLLPCTLLLIATRALMHQGYAALPFFMLAATLCIQSHFATVPLVAGTLFSWLLISRRKGNLRTVVGSAGRCWLLLVAILLWVPLAIYEVRYGPNLLTVATALSQPKAHAGLQEALSTLGYFFRLYLLGGERFPEIWGAARYWVYAVAGFALSFHVVRGIMQLHSNNKAFMICALAPLPLYLATVSRQSSPLHYYYFLPLLPVALLMFGVGFTDILRSMRAERCSQRALSFITVGIWAVTLSLAVPKNIALAARGDTWPHHSLLHAQEVATLLHRNFKELPRVTIFARGHSAVMKDAIIYHLGADYYPQLNYHEQMKELPSFQHSRTEPQTGALLLCGPARQLTTRPASVLKEKDWKVIETIDLSSCSTCRSCKMWRVERTGS